MLASECSIYRSSKLEVPYAAVGFPQPIDPNTIYTEAMASALFLDEPDDIARYVQVFD